MEESDWCPWKRRSDLCLRNAAIDDDLLTLVVPDMVSGLSPEAEEKWCRLLRRWCCSDFKPFSILPTPPSFLQAARDGAPSSWKTSDDAVQLRYCQGFFPAVSLSFTLALNLLTSNRIIFLCPWIAAMWRGVWPHVDLAFMSKAKPAFSTPYLKAQREQINAWLHKVCLSAFDVFKNECVS